MIYFSSGTLLTGGEEKFAKILPALTHLTVGPGLPSTAHSRLMLSPCLTLSTASGHLLDGLQAKSSDWTWAQVLSASLSGS